MESKEYVKIHNMLLDKLGIPKMNEIQKELNKIGNNWENKTVYSTFWIDKKTKNKIFSISETQGKKVREIQAPQGATKERSKRLNTVLQFALRGYNSDIIKGFISGENIQTNAIAHIKPKNGYTVNLDLENAFHQIELDEIQKMFEIVFRVKSRRSENLANMVCYKNRMVQGNPASPMILNIMCLLLDKELSEAFTTVTRYADDITINFNSKKALGVMKKIIKKHNFKLNKKKIKIMSNSNKEITGLIITQKMELSNRKKSFTWVTKIRYKNKINRKIKLFEYIRNKGNTTTKRGTNLDKFIEGLKACNIANSKENLTKYRNRARYLMRCNTLEEFRIASKLKRFEISSMV